MTAEDIREHIKNAKNELHSCVGSLCLDHAGTYISLLAYVRFETAKRKQGAYEIQVMAIQAGDTLGKATALMKCSQEYADYLTYEGLSEALLEMVRTLRKKGEIDKQEEMLT